MNRIRSSRPVRLLPRALLILGVVPALAGCDPCSGFAACGTPQIRYSGQLLSEWNGEPISGLRVELHRRDGRAAAGEPLIAVTDSAGRFTLSGPAGTPGIVEGVLEVYQLDSLLVDTVPVTLATTRTLSDRRDLGSLLISYVHFETFGHIFDRATGAPVPGVEIEFHRTGGIGIEPEIYTSTTDSFGNFPLRPRPLGSGEVVGDVVIRPSAPKESRMVWQFRFSTTLGPDPNPFVARWGVGPQLPYLGRAVWNDTGLPAAGVDVEVRRLAGIKIDPDLYHTRTNDWGVFHLAPRPLATGAVTVLLSFTPSGAATTSYEYTLNTTEEDVRDVIVETWVVPRP